MTLNNEYNQTLLKRKMFVYIKMISIESKGLCRNNNFVFYKKYFAYMLCIHIIAFVYVRI